MYHLISCKANTKYIPQTRVVILNKISNFTINLSLSTKRVHLLLRFSIKWLRLYQPCGFIKFYLYRLSCSDFYTIDEKKGWARLNYCSNIIKVFKHCYE